MSGVGGWAGATRAASRRGVAPGGAPVEGVGVEAEVGEGVAEDGLRHGPQRLEEAAHCGRAGREAGEGGSGVSMCVCMGVCECT